MFYKASSALDERTEFVQLGQDRWRATYRGFVTVSSEGRSPRDSQYNLGEAFDVLLASLIRASRPPATPPPPVVEENGPESTALATFPAPAPKGKKRCAGGSPGKQKRQRR